jgi:hypothetical protein
MPRQRIETASIGNRRLFTRNMGAIARAARETTAAARTLPAERYRPNAPTKTAAPTVVSAADSQLRDPGLKAERNAGPLKPRASQISTEEEKPKKSKLHPYPTVVVLGQQFTCQLPASPGMGRSSERTSRDAIGIATPRHFSSIRVIAPGHTGPFPKCRWNHTEIRPCYCFALFIGT